MRTKKSEKKETPVKKLVKEVGLFPTPIVPTVEATDVTDAFEHLQAIEQETNAGAFEILPGMTVEQITAMFFNSTALVEPPYKIWQLNSKGHRYYYRYDANGNPEFYPSVTTIIDQTLPKSPHLIKWIADKGIEEAERYRDEKAMYGRFMHGAFERLLINRQYNLDALKSELKDYIEVNRLPDDFIYYADDLKKDLLAFAQFVIDYDVRPLAVEIALVHPHYKYAGMIDCPCNMLSKEGGKERINAIIDFKSGRKGFYEAAEIQLHLYKEMWNVNFDHCPISNVFAFSPKDWRKKPSYNFKDFTDSPNRAKIPALLELAAIEDNKKENIFTAVAGVVMLDDAPDLTKNITSLTLSELVKKATKKETPGEQTAVTASDIASDAKEVESPAMVAQKKIIKRYIKTKAEAIKIVEEAEQDRKQKGKVKARDNAKKYMEDKRKLLVTDPEI